MPGTKEVAEIENKIRNGKSKHKDDDLETFDWFYDWCTKVESDTINDILNSMQKKEDKWNNMSVDEQVKDELSRSFISLMATKGRCYARSSQIGSAPKEVEEHIRKIKQDFKDEQNRVESLSEEDRKAELNEAFKHLGPGFFGISIK